jgi:phosphate:Na+ symporter
MDIYFHILGGIGLFLLGMSILTDGLTAFAGESIRKSLTAFTGSPLKALISGAFITALVQSSSATIIAVIGFVSAGILNFTQSLGLVLGASLGTTSTSWIVAGIGLKISIGLYALPLIGAGMMIKLFARPHYKSLGMAISGFALIFLGIDTLQEGMTGLSETIDMSRIPSKGLYGHFISMLIGAFLTIVMQSSSAAVATTLTALHSNTISFEQAASFVIGASIGTTITGLLAAIGGSTAAKRTAASHVLFNFFNGMIAIILLPLFLYGVELFQHYFEISGGAMGLAFFHTLFILTGVLVTFPLITRISGKIEHLIPEIKSEVAKHLDKSVLQIPSVAIETCKRSLITGLRILTSELKRTITSKGSDYSSRQKILALKNDLTEISDFFAKIPLSPDHKELFLERESILHALDHTHRLVDSSMSIQSLLSRCHSLHISEIQALCLELISDIHESLHTPETLQSEISHSLIEEKSNRIKKIRSEVRPEILKSTAQTSQNPQIALEILDIIRWYDRVGYHLWRIDYYLLKKDSHTDSGSALPLSTLAQLNT